MVQEWSVRLAIYNVCLFHVDDIDVMETFLKSNCKKIVESAPLDMMMCVGCDLSSIARGVHEEWGHR